MFQLTHRRTIVYTLDQDETDEQANTQIRAFLHEYKALCGKYGCYVAADGEDVQAVYDPDGAKDANPLVARWGVEVETAERRKW